MTISKNHHKLGLVALILGVWAVPACGGDDDPVPSGGTGGSPSGGSSAGGGSGDDECFDASEAAPTAREHFLNQCNEHECFAFDNTARIEGYTAGAPLPPL